MYYHVEIRNVEESSQRNKVLRPPMTVTLALIALLLILGSGIYVLGFYLR